MRLRVFSEIWMNIKRRENTNTPSAWGRRCNCIYSRDRRSVFSLQACLIFLIPSRGGRGESKGRRPPRAYDRFPAALSQYPVKLRGVEAAKPPDAFDCSCI